jgi:glycosyltransferase involved in cell wall biosynthesis
MEKGNTKGNTEVLYLSYDGLTDPLGQSQILPYLIGLSQKGYNITIISFEKPGRFEADRKFIADICANNRLNWIPLQYHKKPPIISTLWDLRAMKNTAVALHRDRKFRIVHCRSYLSAMIGLDLKRKFSVRFIFDMRGFWADERVEGGLWNLNNPLYRSIYNYFKKMEKKFLFESDSIVSLTHSARKHLEATANIANKITVIPCSVDLQLFDPSVIETEHKSKLRRELGIQPDDFVLTYLGSLGTWYMHAEMMDFFKHLKKLKPTAKFLILTPDIKSVAVADDVIARAVPRNEVPLYTSISNAAIFFIKPSFSKKASSATKMGEVMALGLPIVTNEGWGDIDFFTGVNDAIVLWNEKAAGKIIGNFDSQKIRACARKYLSLEKAIDAYAKIYQELLA